MYGLLFIGAGPHCLTTLLRLLEPDADHSIDLSQRKTTPKAQVLRYWAKQRTDPKHRQHTASWLKENVAVIDPCGSWMGRWQKQFTGLQIKHLRSSSAVHPDPLDTYALVTYAGSQGRMDETLALNHIHKTQDFHGPFHTPGAALFEDFCKDLIHRYCLNDVVVKDKVVGMTPVFDACSKSSSHKHNSSSTTVAGKPLQHSVHHWEILLESGKLLTARTVVVGIGSTNTMRIPPALQQLQAVQPPHSSSSNSTASGSDFADQPNSVFANTCECCSTESSEQSYSFVEWLPDTVVSDAVEKLCIKQPFSGCKSSSSSDGSLEDVLCSSSSEGSWSSSSAASVISPNSTPDNSACGCDICTPDEGQIQQQQQQGVVPQCSAGPTTAAAAAAAGLTAAFDASGSQSPQQLQQQPGATVAVNSVLHLPSLAAAAAAPTPLPVIASAAAGAADSGYICPAAGTYPWGRMLHAWQLVEAVTAAAAPGAADMPTDKLNVSSSSGSSTSPQPTLQDLGLLNPGESVVIIGGGLTSAHLAQLAAGACLDSHPEHSSAGDTNPAAGMLQFTPQQAHAGSGSSSKNGAPVTLLMRGGMRVKQFDVDVPYMGRLRQKKLQEFSQLMSFDQRLALIKQVLQGGSVPPEAAAWLQQLQHSGLLEVKQHSNVVAAEWDWQEGRWDIYMEDGDVLHAHRLWLATGSVVDVSAEPLMQQLQLQLPIPIVSGLPAIQPTLEWTAGSRVYVLGAYAALQLGPGALNLAGAKTASVIMEKQLQTLWQLHVALLHSSSTASTGRSSSGNGSHKQQVVRKKGNHGSCSTNASLSDTAVTTTGTAALELEELAVAPFRPCTAVKGSNSLCLAGLASSHMDLQSSKSLYNNSSSQDGAAALRSVKESTSSNSSSVVKAGFAVGRGYSSPCCGDCWKSRYIGTCSGFAASSKRTQVKQY